MKRWPIYGLGLTLLWVFVRGVELAPMAILGEVLSGLALGMPLAFGLRRFYRPEVALLARARTAPYAVVYVTHFLRELLTANVDVAYRVLAPSLPIEPAVIELPLRVESDIAITTIANSITLTPGTLTMDYDEERNTFYVHAIDGRNRDEVVAPIRAWEDYALRIFDEEREPGDPVPGRPKRERDPEQVGTGVSDPQGVGDDSGGVGSER